MSKKVEKHVSMLKNFDTLTDDQKNELLSEFKKIKLLTPDFANAKTAKNSGRGYHSHILHLAPAKLSGFNMCPAASQGCAAACLNTAGRGRFDSIQYSRIRKTLFFVRFRNEFMLKLAREISNIEKQSAKLGLTPVVRLNGTSDIPWENIKLGQCRSHNIFSMFPNVQFYDYTKMKHRLPRLKVSQLANYHVTFSASESNWDDCLDALKLGFNVATVFDRIPKTYQGFKVIDGDAHDLRFLDESGGRIVGLKAKGDAKKDKSGFVKFIDQKAALLQAA